MKISVCMATFNGEQYVCEQINSIICELGFEDEIVVVDDCSSDSTVNIIRSMNEPRLKLFLNSSNMGHVYSFERAMGLARNEIILLADQDDVWKVGRVRLLVDKLLISGKSLISSNFDLMDATGTEMIAPQRFLKVLDSSKHLRNILGLFLGKRQYYGCTMAFRKELLDLILPIPTFVEAHDIWIALASNVLGSNIHAEEKTLTRRIHKNNITPRARRTFSLVIKSRLIFTLSLVVLFSRAIKLRVKL